jgi:ABC-type transport system involved in cytochrome c biogenesis permease subunit
MAVQAPSIRRNDSRRDLPAPSLGLDRDRGTASERSSNQRSIGFLMLVVAVIAVVLAASRSELGTIGLVAFILFVYPPYYLTRRIMRGWRSRGQSVGRGDWITLFYCNFVLTMIIQVCLIIPLLQFLRGR